jgi:hypothetical protein
VLQLARSTLEAAGQPVHATRRSPLDTRVAGGQLQLAFTHYRRALQLDRRHRGAHEYSGEAYLMANDLTQAEEHLGALERICLIPCKEYEDLKKAVADYRARAAK